MSGWVRTCALCLVVGVVGFEVGRSYVAAQVGERTAPAASAEPLRIQSDPGVLQKVAARYGWRIGTWDVASKWRVPNGEDQWMESKGRAEIRSILNGSAILGQYDFDNGYSTVSISTFDRVAEKWVTHVLDNEVGRFREYSSDAPNGVARTLESFGGADSPCNVAIKKISDHEYDSVTSISLGDSEEIIDIQKHTRRWP